MRYLQCEMGIVISHISCFPRIFNPDHVLNSSTTTGRWSNRWCSGATSRPHHSSGQPARAHHGQDFLLAARHLRETAARVSSQPTRAQVDSTNVLCLPSLPRSKYDFRSVNSSCSFIQHFNIICAYSTIYISFKPVSKRFF